MSYRLVAAECRRMQDAVSPYIDRRVNKSHSRLLPVVENELLLVPGTELLQFRIHDVHYSLENLVSKEADGFLFFRKHGWLLRLQVHHH